MRNKPLTEQVALITGGGTGIGRAFAAALAASNVKAVVIASRREDVLRRTADELNAEVGAERVHPYAFDIRDLGQTE
ncbi:MAG TPA: SDR family NAD(P)-dependent oxidoreductase, partial [Pyrinomonadaceae bacterium]|nr:SDR family NAD(P)-dependent oxidoreductase [Pyrinomonadaceae bacterium]